LLTIPLKSKFTSQRVMCKVTFIEMLDRNGVACVPAGCNLGMPLHGSNIEAVLML